MSIAQVVTDWDAPPVQTDIPQLSASPEGAIDGPIGFIVTDVAGNLYLKGSEQGTLTGWLKIRTTTALLTTCVACDPVQLDTLQVLQGDIHWVSDNPNDLPMTATCPFITVGPDISSKDAVNLYILKHRQIDEDTPVWQKALHDAAVADANPPTTSELSKPPFQTELLLLPLVDNDGANKGSPNGLVYADTGYLIGGQNGYLFINQGVNESSVGWAVVQAI